MIPPALEGRSRKEMYSAVAAGSPLWSPRSTQTTYPGGSVRARADRGERAERVTGTARCYGLMMTRAPMSTCAYSASESEMYIRMQPCEAYVPIDDELYVPWMRIPGALR
jgi:hypothetical protein